MKPEQPGETLSNISRARYEAELKLKIESIHQKLKGCLLAVPAQAALKDLLVDTQRILFNPDEQSYQQFLENMQLRIDRCRSILSVDSSAQQALVSKLCSKLTALDYLAADGILEKLATAQQDPDQRELAEISYQRARIAEERCDLPAAYGFIVKALQLSPADTYYLDYYGTAAAKMGEHEAAIENLQQVLPELINQFGENNENVLDLYRKLGELLLELGEAGRARAYFAKIMAFELENRGKDDPVISVCYFNLGLSLLESGDPQGAIGFFEKSLSGLDDGKNQDKNNLDVANVYNNMGSGWLDSHQYKSALQCFTKALEIDTACFKIGHPDLGVDHNNIADAWRKMENFEKAAEHFELALENDLLSLGDDFPDMAINYDNLADVWTRQGDYARGIHYYLRAQVCEQKYSENSNFSLAHRYCNIGKLYKLSGDMPRAIEYYRNALLLELKVFGKHHSVVANRFSTLASLWNESGNYDKAVTYYKRAIAILKSRQGSAAGNVEDLQSKLTLLQNKITTHPVRDQQIPDPI